MRTHVSQQLLTGNETSRRNCDVGVSAFDWVDLSLTGPYSEPPPPYTPPKPSDIIASPLSPPSYESVAASGNDHVTLSDHVTASTADRLSTHENVRITRLFLLSV